MAASQDARIGRPRVDQAEQRLRALIAEYQRAGTNRLPPEKELSEQLGIGRPTLRQALTRLEADGEIARRRRVGTLISPAGRQRSLAYPVNLILSLSEFLDQVGASYAVRSVTVRREPADADTAAAFGLQPGAPVFRAGRLYEVEGIPAAFLEHRLPVMLDGREVQINALTEGVTTFLRDTEHIQLTTTNSRITAEAATGELAGDLEIATGTPLLVMHAKLYAQRPEPVALGRLVFRPDILCLAATAGEQASPNPGGALELLTLVNTQRPPDASAAEPAQGGDRA